MNHDTTSRQQSTPLYASLALPVPIDETFTYGIPDEVRATAAVGKRAVVPFGKRLLTGFIIELSGNPGDVPPSKIKPIVDIIDEAPVFSDHMLAFARWIAGYYVSSLGEVLKAAMPLGTMIKSRLRVHLTDDTSDDAASLTTRQKAVLNELANHDHLLLKTLEKSFGGTITGTVHSLEKRGFVTVEREIVTPAVKTRTERHVRLTAKGATSVPERAPKKKECIQVLNRYPGGIPLAELLERFGISRGVVNGVVDAGYAEYMDVPIMRRSKLLDQESMKVDHPLTDEQDVCFRLIVEESHADNPRPVLIEGVTGSGKTRVYIELVKRTLAQGKSALILVPEIALTPQTTRFFTSVFPDRVAVLHSAMSPGERYDMWHRIHDGSFDVVIGPRSAVFAPLPSPGIIIVDEEHDSSYKQTDTAPRYNGRDAAVVRGTMLGIPVVLGSATPSMETWHNVTTGKYADTKLTQRVEARPLPEIITVDMREERAVGNYSAFSLLLRNELRERIGRGEKSIVLLNRRGFATSIHCRKCGYILTCHNCEIGLTYHTSKSLAVCHLCGHEQIVMEHCPECGEMKLEYRGMGTQKIERELAEIAGPDAVVRMDSDTTRTHDSHFKLLEEFRNGNRPVLLGTQMVAKGLDIHDVTLVGIISADLALYLPDFRAFERTFQLVTQVAGRAGRGDRPGKVILQTFNPEIYAIETASHHDFQAFAAMELQAREELSFPPFSRLILVKLSSELPKPLAHTAEKITAHLRSQAPDTIEILGPVDAPVARKRGRNRMHILIKSSRPHKIQPYLCGIIDRYATGKVHIMVDVDPIDLM